MIEFKEFYVKPQLPEKLQKLNELAQNIWSTWDSDAYRLFSRIDPKLFRKYNHNPIKLLEKVPQKRWEELQNDKGFIHEMETVYKMFVSYLSFKSEENRNENGLTSNDVIAYFSMEYGLHESLPIYSGGLGILSGDHLKGSSDMGIPLVGFGLLYRVGYFKQKIDMEGNQIASYPENEWISKPIRKLKDDTGKDLIFKIDIRGEDVFIRAWEVKVGNVSLYLLDTNIEENNPFYKTITDDLYVADQAKRILQEILLAYGSIELIKKLNIKPKLYHLNEGHSAFLIIKRLNDLIAEKKFTFDEAVEYVRTTTVFTTHTPVPAGNERFEISLIEYFLKDKIEALGKTFDEFIQLGKLPNSNFFWMPVLAIRFSDYINGVSKLHQKVSQKMWQELFPDFYPEEIPINAITNGVHIQTWLSRTNTRLFDRYIGNDYKHMSGNKKMWENVLEIPNIEIWEAHQRRKEQMIGFLRERLTNSLIYAPYFSKKSGKANNILNHNNLIIGFARRFATYKRASLILQDPQRLKDLLDNKERPVQFIFAGKAHPADNDGQELIKKIVKFATENNLEDKFVFIEDYDMNIARHIVQGVDVWLNNPIKPNEASGTSGMKAGLNGVLNFSVLDGWWPECYNGKNGWAIDAGETVTEQEIRDKLEANQIYDLIENEIAPLYYSRDKNGIPMQWIDMMKKSIYDVGKGFNIHRMLNDYCEKFYIPAVNKIKTLSENDYKKLKELTEFEKNVTENWDKIKFIDVKLDIDKNTVLKSGDKISAEAKIDIADINENHLSLEIIYRINEEDYKIIKMQKDKKEKNIITFKTEFPLEASGKQSINLRIRPIFENIKTLPMIKWYFKMEE